MDHQFSERVPQFSRVRSIVNRVSMSMFGKHFAFRVDRDNRDKREDARIFVQVIYRDIDCRTSLTESAMLKEELWSGRKWYLSPCMTNDEIMKTLWKAFEQAIVHETMEGFRVDGRVLFNPHVDFEQLLEISSREVVRG